GRSGLRLTSAALCFHATLHRRTRMIPERREHLSLGKPSLHPLQFAAIRFPPYKGRHRHSPLTEGLRFRGIVLVPRSILKRLAPSFEACSLRCNHLSPDGSEDGETDANPDGEVKDQEDFCRFVRRNQVAVGDRRR